MKIVLARCAVLFSFLVATAHAQPDPASQPQPGTPLPPRGLADRFGRVAMLTDPTAMLARMKTELKLDAKQEESVKKLLEDYRQKSDQSRRSMSMGKEELEQHNELRRQMMEARNSGNQDQVMQIAQQIKALRDKHQETIRPIQEQLRRSRDELQGQIAGVLTEEQRAGFEKIWSEQAMGPQSGMERLRRNPRLLKGFIDQLAGVSPEQKAKFDDLFKNHLEATRSEKPDSPNMQSLNAKLFEGVMSLLTPEQRQQLEDRFGNRRGPAARRERNRPPDNSGEPEANQPPPAP